MSHAEIHTELKGTRPWVTLMGSLALVFLACWIVLGLIFLCAPGIQGDSAECQRLDSSIRLFAALLIAVSVGGLVTFTNLLRYGLRLGELALEEPASLVRALEARRAFWRQAEWLAWATLSLLPLLIVIVRMV